MDYNSLYNEIQALNDPDLEAGSVWPDREDVLQILKKSIAALYPSFFHYGGSKEGGLLLRSIESDLTHCLEQYPQFEGDPEKAADAYLAAFPEVKRLSLTDLQAIYDGDPAAKSKSEVITCYPGFYAILVYRLAHVLYLNGAPAMARIFTEHAHAKTGIDINPGAAIQESFCIDHGTGIVIGETTVIGDHVKVYQGVTLGALTTRGGQSLRGKRRHPTIEDNVTIYAGASILGGDTVIGRDCVIGSNVFITHSIPPCTTVSVKSQELQIRQRANCPGPFWPEEKKEK